MNRFELSLANDKIWNTSELVRFLHSRAGQDITLSVMPEAHDLACAGVYTLLECFEFASVTIETSNCLEKHSQYCIVKRPLDAFLARSYWQDYDLSKSGQWDRTKLFGVFYGRPSANRIGIASYLLSHHADRSVVIFAADAADPDQRQLFDVDTLFQYRPSSIVDFAQLIQRNYHNNVSYTGLGHEYNPRTKLHDCFESILIDIISEPNIQGTTFYPTEKFSRCVLMKKPFIAMTSANYLSYLRQMGFRTFGQFWNEDYDGLSGENRFNQILSLVDQIAAMPMSQVERMYSNMTDTLEHNYAVLTENRYSVDVKELI